MKLMDYKKTELYCGTVFRFKGKHPFEDIVDFMLIEYPDCDSGFAMVCASGYHAGALELCLPESAVCSACRAISTEWMIENWNRYVYAECGIEHVYLCENEVPLKFE